MTLPDPRLNPYDQKRLKPDTWFTRGVDELAYAGDALNYWLHTVPTTQFQVLLGTMLSLGTFLAYTHWQGLVLRGEGGEAVIAIDAVIFGLWLGFIAACLGIAYKQFHAKRTTDYGYVERKAKQAAVHVDAPAVVNTSGDVNVDTSAEPSDPPAVEPRNAIQVSQTSVAKARDMTRRQKPKSEEEGL